MKMQRVSKIGQTLLADFTNGYFLNAFENVSQPAIVFKQVGDTFYYFCFKLITM